MRTFLEVEPSIEVQEQRKTRHPLTEKNIPPFYDHDIIGLLCIASMFDPCYDIVLAFWKNIIMLNVISTIFSLFITSGLFACSGSKHSGAEFAHDPSRFYTHNGQIFGYCSGSNEHALQGLELDLEAREIRHYNQASADQLASSWWETIQEWNPTAEFDAPAITSDGRFVFFTVYDETEGQIQDAIGVAENSGDPDNPNWIPHGIVVQSFDEEANTPRAMDPSILADAGHLYLIFGSHAGGIYITELDPESNKLLQSPEITSTLEFPERFTRIADNADEEAEVTGIEAPYLHKNDGYYYLFVNFGSCCSGIDSSYEVRVGRSESILGPYLDKEGRPMLEGGGTVFLDAHERYLGPGHVGMVRMNDREIVTYHFYDADDDGIAKVDAKELNWDEDGWPIAGDSLVDW